MPAAPHRCALLQRWLGALCLAVGILIPGLAPAQPEVITNAADVLALSAAEAATARPVRLRGVVISESDPQGRALVVADETGGVYVLAATAMLSRYHRGDLLELSGDTDPGEFAPIVKVAKASKLGTAPLPAPRPVTYHQLITGSLDAQWVEVSGVVQQYLPPAAGSQIRRIVLSVDGGLVHVRITDPRDPELKEDAEVEMHALCFYQFNQKRQMLSPVLQVPTGIPIKIVKPAPADPYAAPVLTANSLLLYTSERSPGHRVHVRGVVTYGQPGSFVWIRDETAGLRLQVRSPEAVVPGEVIDVLGFPKFGSATPTLEDAVYRKLGVTNPPTPLALTNPTAAFNHEDNLVSLAATLTSVEPILEGLSLTLQLEDAVFKAILKLPADSRTRPDWQPGSRVRVTGICSITYDDTKPLMGIWHPQSFQLLLRSPADLVVLEAPSWWTLQHIALLLGIASGALMLAISIVTWLARNRLREQEQHRAMAEAEFAAILSERNRVAREIHDTLAQGLAATSVQLRLARKKANVAGEDFTKHLDTAQQLVRGSLDEARSTIWNMRSQVLETGDLPSALKNILNQMTEGTEVKTDFQISGRARRLAPVIENNLLRVGQEAITNATKHARARQITVTLHYSEKALSLSVTDDGCGFNAQNPPASDGGFGLVGIRERAAVLNGDLKIHAQPGKGTEITLSVPLSGDGD
jgi:signal transduction histidine kinase